MKKVITYGTFDMLHEGHIRLLERARALGDYLIVGVTTEQFDLSRGKLNTRESLAERMAAVRDTGLADLVIAEEYLGQKIDDVRRYQVDIFTVGSDWVGVFDYMSDYCEVVYLDRTEGISSTKLREQRGYLPIGIVGGMPVIKKFVDESRFVSGVEISGAYGPVSGWGIPGCDSYTSFEDLLEGCNAVYVACSPDERSNFVERALAAGKHVICETPMAMSTSVVDRLFKMADDRGLILMDALKTAYLTAFSRLCLMAKSGAVGKIVSVDATCTSMTGDAAIKRYLGGSFGNWAPTALLPIIEILGDEWESCSLVSVADSERESDAFSRLCLVYGGAIAEATVASGAKSEGALTISGTKGYLYVPSPWWKTDYFELRFEDATRNKRFFYQMDGEGLRYEIAAFSKAVEQGVGADLRVSRGVSRSIVRVFQERAEGVLPTINL